MQSALGNPWNPMPGWRYPGLQDEALAPRNTIWNRGVYDAVGVPYAFTTSIGDGEVVLRRVLRSKGYDAVLMEFLRLEMFASYGQSGMDDFYRFWNDAFCWDRNQSNSPPPPFWSRSPQSHPVWQSEDWILTCNSNIPPGAIQGFPSEADQEAWQPGDRPFPRMTQGLNVWSFYPSKAPFRNSDGDPMPYNLWQSQLPGTADSLPADVQRAGVFPFPELVLYGVTGGFLGGVYGSRLVLTPYNP